MGLPPTTVTTDSIGTYLLNVISDISLIVHLIGLALLLGGSLTGLVSSPAAESRSFGQLLWIGAALQLLSGLALTGILEATEAEVNHMKIVTKLVALIGASLIAILYPRKTPQPAWMLWGIGSLTLLAAGIAVLW